MFKKIISLILCASIVLSLSVVVLAADKVKVSITAEECTVGEEVAVYVTMTENTTVCGGSLTVDYDTNYMELIDVVKQDGLTGASVTINKTYEANKIRIVWYGTRTIPGGNLVKITYKTLRDGVTTPDISTLKLSDLDANALETDIELNPISVKPVFCNSISIVGDAEISGQASYSVMVLPEDATYKSVEWSVDDTDVALVDDFGTVTPIKNGVFTLRATATDGSGVYGEKVVTIKEQEASDPVFTIQDTECTAGDEVDVTVNISGGSSACIGSLIISYDSELLEIVSAVKGEALSELSGSVNTKYSANQVKIIWYGSKNPAGGALATLKFKALRSGNARLRFSSIKVSNVNSNSLKYETVTGKVMIFPSGDEKIEIQGSDVARGATQYIAVCTPSTIAPDLIHWSVDDTEIAEISKDGVLIPKKAGEVIVSVYVDDSIGCFNEKKVYVTPNETDEFFFLDDATPSSATLFAPENKNAVIVFAAYQNEVLSSLVIIESELTKGFNAVYPSGYDYSDADTIKVLCLESMDTLEPVCNRTTVNVKKDTDSDGLPDIQEDELGTDKGKPDTDGDGLNDCQEVLELGSDPLKMDSDDNGISDYDEDFDEDNISNGEEYHKGINPMASDSDGDGLSDYEEINTYNTNPLQQDTDGDGAADGWEINNGFNPLQKDEAFEVSASSGSLEEGDTVAASVVTTLDGKSAKSLSVEPASQMENQMLTSTIAGYLGSAYELHTTGEFDSATLSMEYDTGLGELGEDFQPRIYYYNDNDGTLEELPDQTIENGKVTVTINHFSSYILLNKVEYDKVWETVIKKPRQAGEAEQSLDIAFVIDSSGSMDWNDPDDMRKTLTKNFIERLTDNDKAAVIDFDDYANVFSEFTNNTDDLKNAVDRIDSSGGTAIYTGISSAMSQFDSIEGSADSLKAMFVLTDGEDNYSYDYSTLIDEAKDKNIQIYTVGLGSGINESLLKNIATGTNGKYYHASTSIDLTEGFESVISETVDFVTDSNNDGICDYYTDLIKKGDLIISNGSEEFSGIDFGKKKDLDGDGLRNGEELIITYNEEKGTVYMQMYSNPLRKDSDGDGYSDKEEKRNGTNPMKKTFDTGRVNSFKNSENTGYNYYNIIEKYDNDAIFRAEQEFFNYGLAGGMNKSAIKQIIDYLYTYCDDEFILNETNEYIKMAIFDSLNENLKKTNKFIKETKKSVSNFDDFYKLISPAVEYKEKTEALIDRMNTLLPYDADGEYNKLLELLNNEYVENLNKFNALGEGTTGNKIDFKLYGISSKYNQYLDTPISGSLTKGKAISYSLSTISLGLDIAEDIATYSKINANSKIFQDNLDILVAIRDNAKHQRVSAAAQTVINAMGEGTTSYCGELAIAIGRDVGTQLKSDLEKLLLNGNPVLTGYNLAMGAIKLFKWDTNVKSCLKIYICEDMRQSVATLANGEFERLQDKSFYEINGDEKNAVRHLTHLAQLRIIAANTYIDLIEKRMKYIFEEEVYYTICSAENLNLYISRELLSLKDSYKPED